ncbi:MAG: hypothetical protein ACRERU_05210 [Methylococcales bacterium]
MKHLEITFKSGMKIYGLHSCFRELLLHGGNEVIIVIHEDDGRGCLNDERFLSIIRIWYYKGEIDVFMIGKKGDRLGDDSEFRGHPLASRCQYPIQYSAKRIGMLVNRPGWDDIPF